MDVLTPEQRRRNMQAIRSSNTKIEIKLAKGLWQKGLRYRKNDKSVFGKPDITFKKYKVAIFCDSEFWHGKNWKKQSARLDTNKDYWNNKILSNIQRDKKVTRKLKREGWVVIRFWETSIKKDISKCIELIELALSKRKNQFNKTGSI
jgi:DNA mismatch endonuclease (patch repair protein)